jgi:Mg2+ and Co2+ transporter CorA
MRTPPEYHPNKKPTFPNVNSNYLKTSSIDDITNEYNKNVEKITNDFNENIDIIFEKHKEEFTNKISGIVDKEINYVFNRLAIICIWFSILSFGALIILKGF